MSREDLAHVLGFDLTDEQWECVSAPMRPMVIVAGAGTGKTTVMAARVLWLVASGDVAEHEVLGLTFTRKAADELGDRIGDLLERWRGIHGRVPEAKESRGAGSSGPAADEHPPGGVASDGGGSISSTGRAQSGQPAVSTYHAFAGDLLREHGLRLGIEPGARLLTAPAGAQVASRVVATSDSLGTWSTSPVDVVGAALRLDANLAEQSVSVGQILDHDRAVIAAVDSLPRPPAAIARISRTARKRSELAAVVEAIRAARSAAGRMDFGDQMRFCAELASTPEVGERLRESYRLILLDEYQDTSIVQRMILSSLFAGCSVTSVGDPLQAIYGWRSASVANIAAFPEHFGATGPDAIRVLTWNRRSRAAILEAANRIARPLRAHHPEVHPLTTDRPEPGTVRAALLPDVVAERAWVAEQVADLIASGRPAESIAILGRANDDLLPLRDCLRERGIQATVWGSVAVVNDPHVDHVVSMLRLLVDPQDNAALVAVLSCARWGIGATDLAALGRRARRLSRGGEGHRTSGEDGGSAETRSPDPVAPTVGYGPSLPLGSPRAMLLAAVADPGPGVSQAARARLAEFMQRLRELEQARDLPLLDLVSSVMRLTGVDVESVLVELETGVPNTALSAFLHLVADFKDGFGEVGLSALIGFLDTAGEMGVQELAELPRSPGSVSLMTMHKAKGLEFDVVLLPHLCRAVFPSTRPSPRWTATAHVVPVELRDDQHVLPALTDFTTQDLRAFEQLCRDHDRSGEDRLAYVAVTRARDTVIASGHWWGPTQSRLRGPSDYLLTLHECAAADSDDPWACEPTTEDGSPPLNPHLAHSREFLWPAPDTHEAARELAAMIAAGVSEAATAVRPVGFDKELGAQAADGASIQPRADGGDAVADRVPDKVAAWDEAIVALLSDPPTTPPEPPEVLTASEALELARDHQGFLDWIRRPLPRPQRPESSLGVAFHEWVQRRSGQLPLIDDEDLPHADHGLWLEEELDALKAAFERLPYASVDAHGVEVPFSLALDGRVIRGRIDAVYRARPGSGAGIDWEVVDWKTSRREKSDPLQLAIYRLAWADLMGVPVSTVSASFVHIPTGRIETPESLPNSAGVAALLRGAP